MEAAYKIDYVIYAVGGRYYFETEEDTGFTTNISKAMRFESLKQADQKIQYLKSVQKISYYEIHYIRNIVIDEGKVNELSFLTMLGEDKNE